MKDFFTSLITNENVSSVVTMTSKRKDLYRKFTMYQTLRWHPYALLAIPRRRNQ